MIPKLIISLLLIFLFLPSNLSAQPMLKALWVTAGQMTSKEKIDRFVDYAKKYDFDILFVQTRSRGYVYYPSKIEPRHPDISPAGFDPLAYVIKAGRKNGIEIHAWMNAYFVWAGDNIPEAKAHVIRQHPEWIIKDPAGWYYLIPEKDRANKYLLSIYTEVADKYAVDGIHFDYIRYPERAAVKKNAEAVTDLVKRVAEAARKQNQKIVLSAAVYPDIKDAREDKGQDWKRWLDKKYLDFAVPMAYSMYTDEVKDQVSKILKEVSPSRIIVGLGAYRLTPVQLKEKIDAVKKNKLRGVALFSYDSMVENF